MYITYKICIIMYDDGGVQVNQRFYDDPKKTASFTKNAIKK